MRRGTARVLMACWATLPVGAIASIYLGDLRWLGIGLVLFAAATAWGLVITESVKAKIKADAQAEAQIREAGRKFLDDLAAGKFHRDGER